MKRFKYHGDVNPECGGYLVNLSEWKRYGYANVVRITPCSDAGGPSNLFWVEALTVLRNDQLPKALECCGYDAESVTPSMEVDAALAYGAYDPSDRCPETETVQIGKEVDLFWNGHDKYEPTVVLRSNASILRFARSMAADL